MVVLSLKIGNNEPLEPFSIGLRSDHECRRTSSPRIHGIRRRDRRRRAVRSRRCDPAEAAQCRSQHRRGGEGFRGRRAYPVGRRDRSGFARQTDPGLARGCGLPAEDAGQGRPLLLDHRDQRDPAAGFCHAAADGQPSLLYRLARRCLPLAGAEGGSARRRNLSGLCRGRSAVRRQRRGPRHRDRRHGRRQGWQAEGFLHPRHGTARQVHAVRRRRARQPEQAADREIFARRQERTGEIRHRPEGSLGDRSRKTPEGPDPALVRLAA